MTDTLVKSVITSNAGLDNLTRSGNCCVGRTKVEPVFNGVDFNNAYSLVMVQTLLKKSHSNVLSSAHGMFIGFRQIAHQLVQRLCIHFALEFNHRANVQPIIIPTPGIELGMSASSQTHITITAHQTQQEPYLFLPAIIATRFALVPSLWNLITHPFAGASEDFHMLWQQAHFLVQFAVHRLFRILAMLYSALRKLPRVLPDPLAPEHLILVVRDDDADIRSIAVSVYHVQLYWLIFNARILSYFACYGKHLRRKDTEFRAYAVESRPRFLRIEFRIMRVSQFFISTQKEAPAEA